MNSYEWIPGDEDFILLFFFSDSYIIFLYCDEVNVWAAATVDGPSLGHVSGGMAWKVLHG